MGVCVLKPNKIMRKFVTFGLEIGQLLLKVIRSLIDYFPDLA